MKLITTDATPVYDMGNYPVCYADGITEIDQARPNSRLVFSWCKKWGMRGLGA